MPSLKPKSLKADLSLPVYDLKGAQTGKIALDSSIFDGRVNISLLHQAVVMYQANKRRGTASTKTRAEVSGGGKKPWRQKGTGRARVGSIRSPIWRGGGIIFGPKPRDFSYTLPQRLKNEALKSILNSRFKDGRLRIVEEIKLEKPKTKEMVSLLSKQMPLKENKILLVLGERKPDVILACRNLSKLDVKTWRDICAYDCLRSDELVFTKDAFENFQNSFLKKTKK